MEVAIFDVLLLTDISWIHARVDQPKLDDISGHVSYGVQKVLTGDIIYFLSAHLEDVLDGFRQPSSHEFRVVGLERRVETWAVETSFGNPHLTLWVEPL